MPPEEAVRSSALTRVWNVTGQPAVSLPLGRTAEGLPVGVQLVGPPGGDELSSPSRGQLERAGRFVGARPEPASRDPRRP